MSWFAQIPAGDAELGPFGFSSFGVSGPTTFLSSGNSLRCAESRSTVAGSVHVD